MDGLWQACGNNMRSAIVLAWGTLAGLASAQTEQAPAAAGPEVLRAHVAVTQKLFDPTQPVRVHFALHNPTDRPVEIPLELPIKPADGIALPLELITGTPNKPALFVSSKSVKATTVRPVNEPASEQGERVLRLAPGGTVGAEIDLREIYKSIRYTDSYRIEWRPLGGRIPSASVEFRVEPRKVAVLVTDYGKLTFSLMYEKAPRNVDNFLELTRDGFYSGKTFHRIIPGFIIQGGCPLGNGNGVREDGKLLEAEFHDAAMDIGVLAMAHKPDDPNTASCQFFVALSRLEELDGKYTIIGRATDEASLRTLQQLAALETDRADRPLRQVYIRSINLIDAGASSTGRHDVSRP